MADGLGIGSMSYGYDEAGVETYLAAIKADLLTTAQEHVKDTSTIKTACNEHWAGKAKDKFIENLDTDAEHVAEQFNGLYLVLEGEINQALAAMKSKDDNMINF